MTGVLSNIIQFLLGGWPEVGNISGHLDFLNVIKKSINYKGWNYLPEMIEMIEMIEIIEIIEMIEMIGMICRDYRDDRCYKE